MSHSSNSTTPTPLASDKKPRLLWHTVGMAWRMFSVLSKVVLVLVILFAVYAVFTNWRGEGRMREALQKLEEHGITAEMQAAYFVDPPDEEDGGARYYLAAFALLEGPWSEREDLPCVGVAEEPGLCEPIDGETAKAMAVYIESKRDYFQALARALEHPQPKYNIRWFGTATNGMEIISDLRTVADHQSIVALLAQSNREVEAALAACGVTLRIVRTLRDAPQSDLLLARMLLIGTALDQIEQILSRLIPPSERLRALGEKFLEAGEGLDIRRAVAAELAFSGGMLRFLPYWHAQSELIVQEHLAAPRGLLVKKEGEENAFMLAEHMEDAQWKKWQNSQRWRADLRSLYLMVCPGAYKTWFSDAIQRTLREYQAADVPDHTFAARVAADGDESRVKEVYQMGIKLIEAKARCRVSATALAVEAYRLEKGRWPAHLGEVGQDNLLDPFTGEPLKCRRVEEGFTVYSVGRNLADDGGVKSESPSRDGVWLKDDLAFRLFDPERRNVKAPQGEDAESGPVSDY